VLHGFAAGDRDRIGDSFERELALLLVREGLPALAESMDRLDGGSFWVAPGAGPRIVGAQIAQRVYERVAPSRKNTPRPARSQPERGGP
jgi:hypothetical protein